MTELAVAFAWAWSLPDWVTGDALGMSEDTVRRMRRGMGLKKTGGGGRADAGESETGAMKGEA
tara:strand:- start:6369 stop:6557 length:189 start_codon:yes stop_codon:yes gene_type:complete